MSATESSTFLIVSTRWPLNGRQNRCRPLDLLRLRVCYHPSRWCLGVNVSATLGPGGRSGEPFLHGCSETKSDSGQGFKVGLFQWQG